MLESLFHYAREKIALVGCLTSLMFFSGCAERSVLTTVSPKSLQSLSIQKDESEFLDDYSHLNWKEAVERIKTPEEAQHYLDTHFKYKEEERYESFRLNHQDGKGVCYDYSLAAAALLRDDGYPPLIFEMISDDLCHTVFIYKEEEK